MSHYDYEVSKRISGQDFPFYSLIMSAMRQADTYNLTKLQAMWPEIWEELDARYNAPGGLLPEEREGQSQIAQDLREAQRVLREEPERFNYRANAHQVQNDFKPGQEG